MQITIQPSEQSVATIAADRLAGILTSTQDAVLGVATGSSPGGVYRELAERVRSGALDLSRTRAFALDEYVGIPREHPQSYSSVVDREIVRPLGMDPSRVAVPDGLADDLVHAAARYEASIAAAGGVDVQILGIGSNGHIGFNEPGSPIASRTRVVELAPVTRRDNARFFADEAEVPRRALTQGIATILAARSLMLVAQGERKAEAVRRLVEGEPSIEWPATALRRHPDVLVVLDEGAASLLDRGRLAERSVADDAHGGVAAEA